MNNCTTERHIIVAARQRILSDETCSAVENNQAESLCARDCGCTWGERETSAMSDAFMNVDEHTPLCVLTNMGKLVPPKREIVVRNVSRSEHDDIVHRYSGNVATDKIFVLDR